MDALSIGDAPAHLRGALLELNNRFAHQTSPLEERSWSQLVGMALAALTIDPPSSLIVALDQDAPYDSPNFRWFRDRFPRFVYVDRIVVAEEVWGRGLARALYEAVIAQARRDGHDLIACEVNRVPANPASDAFHTRMGFVEAGRSELPGGKIVRYLTRSLADPS